MSRPNERKLSRETLEDNCIFFFEELDREKYPPHIESLRATLCDINCSLARTLIFSEGWGYEYTPQRRLVPTSLSANLKAWQEREFESTWRGHYDIRSAAISLHGRCDQEQEWAAFYNKHFFSPLAAQTEITDGDSRRISRAKYYYENFKYAEERPWTLFTDEFRREYNQSGLPQPKPDLVAYFPMYDLNKNSEYVENRSQRWNWAMWPSTDAVDNFSRQSLEDLFAHGLRPSVTSAFSNGSTGPLDYICYPWLIVEHKSSSEAEAIECYCRAANSAAAQLLMYRILAKHANHKLVPTVVTMTTTGKYARIWIAYFDTASEQYNMICVWKGDMTSDPDTIALECVLENLHTWAMHTLRPCISHYIDQWKQAIQQGQENSDNRISPMEGNKNRALHTRLDKRPEQAAEQVIGEIDRLTQIFRREIGISSEKLDSLLSLRQAAASLSHTGSVHSPMESELRSGKISDHLYPQSQPLVSMIGASDEQAISEMEQTIGEMDQAIGEIDRLIASLSHTCSVHSPGESELRSGKISDHLYPQSQPLVSMIGASDDLLDLQQKQPGLQRLASKISTTPTVVAEQSPPRARLESREKGQGTCPLPGLITGSSTMNYPIRTTRSPDTDDRPKPREEESKAPSSPQETPLSIFEKAKLVGWKDGKRIRIKLPNPDNFSCPRRQDLDHQPKPRDSTCSTAYRLAEITSNPNEATHTPFDSDWTLAKKFPLASSQANLESSDTTSKSKFKSLISTSLGSRRLAECPASRGGNTSNSNANNEPYLFGSGALNGSVFFYDSRWQTSTDPDQSQGRTSQSHLQNVPLDEEGDWETEEED